ncbi:MAG TPA: phosphotransferase [Candidatus Dormibacteraeota bacterium]|nr:phosphotransferase [Candidatus Dormibacteraeota bacterium]
MVLTTKNIVHYLMERGLVSRGSVVDGDLWIVESTRRNRNYKVIRRQSPGYFVKQVQTFDPQAIASLRCESSCYWLAKNDPDFAALAPLLPAYHDFDAGANILVLGLLPGSESLSDHHRRTGEFSLESAESLARILATYHRGVPARARKSSLEATFPQRVPWILSIDQFNAAGAGAMSGGNTQIVGIIQRYPEFHASLETLRAQWSAQCLIHGDVKWDNCLLVPKDGNGSKELKLIDWELSDFGDPCWDVGAVFQAYLSFWIFSMPAQAETTTDDLVARAQFPVEKMQPAMQHFWKTYAELMEIPKQNQAEKLERSVRSAAARMIQTAYEYMYYAPQVSTNILYLLQVSVNVLTRPQEAIRELLGF